MQAEPISAKGTSAGNVAVIILTMNQRDKTLQCLSSLRAVKRPHFQIVLWDNGSSDGTAEAVRAAFPEVLVHYHSSNLGVASGRNAAAKLAIETFDSSYLLFLDNDMIVTPNFLEALLEPFPVDSRLAQTQAKLRFLKDRQRLNDGGGARIQFWLGRIRPVGYGEIDSGQYDTPTKCIACGGATLVRRDVFQQLGGFDSSFDPFGPEDLDFSLRAAKAGYYGLYVPRALIFHEVSHTFEGGGFSEKYAKHKAHLWFLFMRRHASLLEQLAFVFLGAPYILARVMLREGRKGNLSALRGLVHGMLDFWKSSLRARQ
jgi:GT2 family glycosyltransferase